MKFLTSMARMPLLLLGLTLLLSLVLRDPPPRTIDVGAAGDTAFVGGFFTPEFGEGATFRWSGPAARLVLHGASAGPQLLVLRLSGERLVALGAPELRLEVGNAPPTRFIVHPGWRTYHLLLPPGAAADQWGSAAPLELRSALERPGSEAGDERRIGIPLDTINIVPLDLRFRPPAEPLARALMLTWLVAVLAGGYVWAERQFVGRRHPTASMRSILLILPAGGALLLAAWRDPYLLARTLPPMPWLLGLLSLLLLAGRLLERAPRTDSVASPSRAWPIIGGLGLLAVANGLLNSRLAPAAGITLAVGGLLLLAWSGLGEQVWQGNGNDLTAPAVRIGLGLVLLIALAMRFYQIDRMPFGLWRDEARHGLVALRMIDDSTYRPIYIAEERVNMPALGLYPFALALQIRGVAIETMRLVTAAAGALTVLPLYGLVRRLSGRRDLALLSAALLAVSSWHIAISRFSFPTIFDPLLTLSGLWLLTIALDQAPQGRGLRWLPSIGGGLLAGVCLGLAMQTYHTGRIAPLLGGGLALLLLWQGPQRLPAPLAGVGAAILGAALVTWPLAVYALSRPEAFNERVGDVFLLSEKTLRGLAPLSMLDETLRRHLLMFNVQGDINGRHHAPFRPLLDYAGGIGLLAGAAALLHRWRDWRSLLLFGGLGLGLAPSALAVDAPHAMRSLDACAFACVIAALGWSELGRLAGLPAVLRETGRQLGRRLPFAAGLLALVLNGCIYFVIMPPDREVWVAFYPVQSRMGAYVRQVAAGEGPAALNQLFVPAELQNDPVFVFLTHGLPTQGYNNEWTSTPARAGARFLLGGYNYREEAASMATMLGPAPQPSYLGPPFPDGSAPSFVVYTVNTDPLRH